MTGTVPWTIVLTAADRDVNDGATLAGRHSCSKSRGGEGAKVIYLSPQGRKLDQAGVASWQRIKN